MLAIVQSKVAPMAERQALSQTDWHHFPQHQSCCLSAGHRFLISYDLRVHQLNPVASLSYLAAGAVQWDDEMAPIGWKAVA